ncbi:BEN domain-containing protein 6-like [Engraulis encrasicolus]|uniref:BEN domain-containing protein 6-like n=1 Tax=Engraulis encrasicolus TaxID=184585 RepID=UPI002FD6E806
MLTYFYYVFFCSVLPDILEKLQGFLEPTLSPAAAPRPGASGPAPTQSTPSRPAPTQSTLSRPPAPTQSTLSRPPAPTQSTPSRPAPTQSEAAASPAPATDSIIPKGLVERCSIQNPQKFINDLLHGLYTREFMCAHSVTGQTSSSGTEKKPGLPQKDLVEITNAAKTKFQHITDSNVKAFIRQKLNNAAKLNK